MATTEFNDAQHFGIFTTSATLTSQTGKMVRQSELVLSALRAQGVFDNLVDSTTAPDHDKLWLDKNSDPAVLKEWDSVGSSWATMTFDRLFARAVVTPLTLSGGTANAVQVSQPTNFIDNRLYSLTPTANNTGATTIQVTGVGTYDVKYHDGTDVDADEFVAGQSTVLLFTAGRFEILYPFAPIFAAKTAAETAAANLAGAFPADAAALKALDTTAVTGALRKDGDKGGTFLFQTGDYSTEASADTAEGVYVKADDVATNVGIWVRQLPTNALDLNWFVEDADDDYQPALTRAIALGIPIDLRDRSHDIGGSGNNAVLLADGTHIFGGVIKDVNAAGSAGTVRRLLYGVDKDNIKIQGVEFDRNGTGANGSAGNNSGTVYIHGGSGHLLESLEAYGDNKGNIFIVEDAAEVVCRNLYVHDINYTAAVEPVDDVVNGIAISGCSNFLLENARVERIFGDWGDGVKHRYSRGILIGETSWGQVRGVRTDFTDAAIDLSGGSNEWTTLTDIECRNSYNFAVKFADATRATLDNFLIENVGWRGITITQDSGLDTGRIVIGQGYILRPGTTHYDADTDTYAAAPTHGSPPNCGISVVNDSASSSGPKGVDISDHVHVEDDQGRMDYGFWCDVAATANGPWIRLGAGATSIGHGTAAVTGFHAPYAKVRLTSAQSIPDATWTDIEWDTATLDGMAMFNVAFPTRLTTRSSELFQAEALGSFASNGTGVRGIQILAGGVVIAREIVPALTGIPTSVATMASSYQASGVVFTTQVYQSSGGALNFATAGTVDSSAAASYFSVRGASAGKMTD